MDGCSSVRFTANITTVVESNTVDKKARHNHAPARPVGTDHTKRDVYDGADLRRPVSVNPARFLAFELPSRMGSRLYYPNGDVRWIDS